MLKKLISTLVILLVAVSFSHAGSTPNLKEGKWEITSKMEMPGMPGGMVPVKHTQCLTNKDFVPQSSQPNQECKVDKTKVSGDTVSWVIECNTQGGKMTGTGKITYHGNSFEGTIKTTMANMEMTTHISGRRLGKCD